MLADCTSCVRQSRIYPCYTTWRTPIIRCRSAHLVEIPVYRQSLQCGERSNAAFGKQSAAILPSLAPHDSKARLQTVTTFRRFMAKPCTPHLHCAARAALQAPDRQCAGSRGKAPRPFSRGFKGDTLFREREYPPFYALLRGAGNPPTASGRHNFQALCASKPFKDFFSSRRNTITLRRNGKKYVATR